MNRFFHIAVLVVAFNNLGFGQNLVQNYSFEDTIYCPTCGSSISTVSFWYDAQVSCDYFSFTECWALPPHNSPQWHQNPRTGFAFAGFGSATNREYLGGSLISSLVAGKKYCVEFYINMSIDDGISFTPSDSIGIYFSNESVLSTGCCLIPYPPQVINSGGIIDDTLNWILISGSFIATGGEKFITIGDFSIMDNYVYYFIDDVSTYLCDSTPETDSAIFVPNAFSPNADGENDLFLIRGDIDELHCYIFNRWGEQVAQIDLPEQGWDGRVNGIECNTGVYFYYLNAKDKNGNEILKKGNVTLLR